MNPFNAMQLQLTRRHFLGRAAKGIGSLALASLLNPRLFADTPAEDGQSEQSALRHHQLTSLGGPLQRRGRRCQDRATGASRHHGADGDRGWRTIKRC